MGPHRSVLGRQIHSSSPHLPSLSSRTIPPSRNRQRSPPSILTLLSPWGESSTPFYRKMVLHSLRLISFIKIIFSSWESWRLEPSADYMCTCNVPYTFWTSFSSDVHCRKKTKDFNQRWWWIMVLLPFFKFSTLLYSFILSYSGVYEFGSEVWASVQFQSWYGTNGDREWYSHS